jgi:hypothetical protein
MLATSDEMTGLIARRSPAASSSTRTLHFEIDLADPQRRLPVGTTADLTIQVGKPEAATVIPGISASVRGEKATIFIADGDRAKKAVIAVKGESLGTLFVDVSLTPGTRVITEGRSLLLDGDLIAAKLEAETPASAAPRASAAGAAP